MRHEKVPQKNDEKGWLCYKQGPSHSAFVVLRSRLVSKKSLASVFSSVVVSVAFSSLWKSRLRKQRKVFSNGLLPRLQPLTNSCRLRVAIWAKASKKAGTASASPSDLVLFKGQPPPVAGLLYLRRSRLQFAFPGTVLLWHSSSSHGWIQTHTHCTRMLLTRLTEWERSYCCNKKNEARFAGRGLPSMSTSIPTTTSPCFFTTFFLVVLA